MLHMQSLDVLSGDAHTARRHQAPQIRVRQRSPIFNRRAGHTRTTDQEETMSTDKDGWIEWHGKGDQLQDLREARDAVDRAIQIVEGGK